MNLSYVFEQAASNHVRIVKFSTDVLAGLLSLNGDKLIKIDGMPADARIVDVQLDFLYDRVLLKVHSKEFSPVSEGSMIPELPLIVRYLQMRDFTEFAKK